MICVFIHCIWLKKSNIRTKILNSDIKKNEDQAYRGGGSRQWKWRWTSELYKGLLLCVWEGEGERERERYEHMRETGRYR